jgi:hypothetical protein
MAGFTATNDSYLIRANIWSQQLKDVLEEELYGQKWVDWITDFPDGDTLNIPSIGAHEIKDYVEGQQVQYTAMDTGNFTFTIDQYKSAATYITEQHKQDSMYMARLVASFVPKQRRAIAEAMETRMFERCTSGQTASDPNLINGGDHRRIGSGTNEVIAIKDFALAKYALRKANVPMTNLIAIVDPSVEYELSTHTNLVNVSNNKAWEGVIRDGMSTGMRFFMNIYGFDVYVSDFLPTGLNETITPTVGSAATTASGVGNLFFSAAPDILPIVGNVRQAPKVDSEFNKDWQREEYVTTTRYGFKLYRPENLVTIITDTDQVS